MICFFVVLTFFGALPVIAGLRIFARSGMVLVMLARPANRLQHVWNSMVPAIT